MKHCREEQRITFGDRVSQKLRNGGVASLGTGRPNALRVTVGNTEIPALGPAERTISDVSLAPADLLARLGPATGAPAPTTVPPPPSR